MAWEVVPNKNNVKSFISIYRNHVVFNTGTVRVYGLKKYKRVVLLVDDVNKKIGFKFSTDPKEPNSFSLTSSNNYLTLYTKKLTYGRDWLQLLLLKPASDRRFVPRYDTTEDQMLTITITVGGNDSNNN